MPLDLVGLTAQMNQRAGTLKQGFNHMLKQDFVSAKRFSVARTAGTYTAGKIRPTTTFLQAYQGAFTPKAGFEISGETLELQEMKIDIHWTADNINSFLSKWNPQASQFGDSPLNNRFFTDYLLMEHIYPSVLEELEALSFKGEYVAPTAGQPGVSINSCDGLNKRIEDAVAAGTMSYMPVGAITTTNIYDKTILFCRSLPETYQNKPLEIECSRAYMEMFADAVYEKGKTTIDPRTLGYYNEYPIPNTNKKLVCLPSMSGSMRLVLDGKGGKNKVMLLPSTDMKDSNDYQGIMPVINWETSKRDLYGWGNFQLAFGFEYGAEMFVSDTE